MRCMPVKIDYENLVSRLKKKELEKYAMSWEYSINVKRDGHNRTKVDKTILKNIKHPWYIDEVLTYPKNKEFAVCLTHDVDVIKPSIKRKLHLFLKQIFEEKNLRLDTVFEPYDFLYTFKKIVNIEKSFGASSTFFFIAAEDSFSKRYNLSEVVDTIHYLEDEGFEIGLHGGYFTYNSYSRITREKATLEKYTSKEIIGYRNHYLRFEVPRTWYLLRKAGFKYDTTIGYASLPGWKNGFGYPFLPYDFTSSNLIDPILEIPLVIMDTTFLVYLKYDLLKSWQTMREFVDTARRHRAVLTILWHNDKFDEIYFPGYSKLYKMFLEYVNESKGWLTNCRNLYYWWVND